LKLNRNNWLLIAAGILAVVIAGLGVIYVQQVERQKELSQKFVQTATNPDKTDVSSLTSQKAGLEEQISAATSQLEAVRAGTPSQSVSSITRALFDVAKTYGMDVTELVSSVPTRAVLEGVDFSMLSLTLRADGDASKMADFIAALNGSFSTGLIKSVNVTMSDNSSAKAIIEVDMAVYSN
jgi:hypothetical protein